MRRTALLSLLCLPASAAQLPLERPALCALADVVVWGVVRDTETLWAAGSAGGIERRAFVETRRVLRGDAPPPFEVVLPGGQIGAMVERVEDVPDLRVGAEYLLLLARTPGGLQVIGGDAGAIRIAPGDFGQGEPIADALASLGACRAP